MGAKHPCSLPSPPFSPAGRAASQASLRACPEAGVAVRPVGRCRVQKGARKLGGPNAWNDRDSCVLRGGDWLKDACQDLGLAPHYSGGQCSLGLLKYIVFSMLLWFLNTEEPSVSLHLILSMEARGPVTSIAMGRWFPTPSFGSQSCVLKLTLTLFPHSGLQGGY